MLALCETVHCRRVNLLGYFGQQSTPCGNCDTCLEPPESWDGTIAAQKLLSTVVRLQRERNQRFGAGQLVDILRGKVTDRVTQLNHQTLSTWGIGQDLSEQQWRGVVRQLLAQGLLAVNDDGYGTLVVTEASGEVLADRHSVSMRREAERAARSVRSSGSSKSKAATAELAPADQALFEKLRAWRAGEAREQGVPAYIVFGDATLRAIATLRPSTLAEAGGISGIGEAKLQKYGEGLLEVVASDSIS
jgi:ATP-dependent DNA helicase RecQ